MPAGTCTRMMRPISLIGRPAHRERPILYYNDNRYVAGSNARSGIFSIAAVPEPARWTLILVGSAL